RRASPRLDGVGLGLLLLVGVPEQHPVAAPGKHRVEVLDAAQVVAQLRRPDLYDEGGRVLLGVAEGLVLRGAGWGGEDPRVLAGAGPLDIDRHERSSPRCGRWCPPSTR